jgi:hypothetical protein
MGKNKQASSKPQARPVLVLGRSREAAPLIHRQLEVYRRRHQNGDGEALLLALDVCLSCFRGSPDWVADEFFRAMSDWRAYRAATLDEAFGVRRAHKHIAQRREREALRPAIMLRLAHLQQQNAPMDARTFARVGEEISKSASFVSSVYYQSESAAWRKLLHHFRIRRQPLKISTK